jgi:hypothetical protein
MNNLILDSDRKEEATKLLNSWANCFLELEKDYFVRRNEVSNRDYKFLKLIGQSVYYINSFNSLLISSIEDYAKSINNDKISRELKCITRYVRFFNSLVASKIKFFFFREMPIRNTNSPFVKLDFQILKIGNELINELSKNIFSNMAISISVSKYFYLQALLYSFIYHSQKEKGAFLRFRYDEKSYTIISKIILEQYTKATSEIQIRLLGSNVIAIIASHYIDKDGQFNIDTNAIMKPDCYDNLFLKLSKSSDTYIEPLTLHLADILWKIDGMIHDDDEYINSNDDKIRHENETVNCVKDFVENYFNKTKAMYRNNEINFLDIFELEKNFFNRFYPLVFNQSTIEVIRDKFEKINKANQCAVKCEDLQLNFDINDTDLINIFDKVRDSGERGFKLETLIEILDTEELLALFSSYSKLIPKEDIVDKKTEFVGFYKSGIFLGHIVNILNSTSKPIWLFKSKPYVATHPIHEDKEYNDFNKIIIFDECLKTGFTYSLYESYLTRNLYSSHLSTALYSIFDFTSYTRIEFKDHVNFYSLIKLNDINFPINNNELQVHKQMLKKQKNISFSVNENNMEEIVKIIQYSSGLSRIPNRVDLTFLLSNTETLYSVCNIFAGRIISQNNSKKDIMLSTASSDGEVLILVTAFILKLKCKQVKIKFYTGGDISKSFFNVAIDLSLMSGFSLGHMASRRKKCSFSEKMINDALDSFDLICSIVSQGQHRRNLFSLYEANSGTFANN